MSKLGRNCIWEATSAFPSLKGVSKTWDTYNANDLTKTVQMEQLQHDSCLFYRFEPSQEQVEEKAGRHINEFLEIGPEPNAKRFLPQAKDTVRLFKTSNKNRLSAINLRKLENGHELQDKPFLDHEIAVNLEIENAKTSLTPESISQKPQDDNDKLPTPSDTQIFRTYEDKVIYLFHQRTDSEKTQRKIHRARLQYVSDDRMS